MTKRETETVARLRAFMACPATTQSEKGVAFAQVMRITTNATTRETTCPTDIYARMTTTPAASTFTAWL